MPGLKREVKVEAPVKKKKSKKSKRGKGGC